jgi:hypothetical protein
MILKYLEDKYKTGDYICVAKWAHKSKLWYDQKHKYPFADDKLSNCTDVKLIHKKHESILDAYFKDRRVKIEVEGLSLSDTNKGDFIDTYNEEWNYTSISTTPSMLSDSEIDFLLSDAKPLNNFREYGFTADFEGEILKKVGEYYMGYIIEDSGLPLSANWDKQGLEYTKQGLQYSMITVYNLKPIIKHWYNDESNFPAIIINIATNEFELLNKQNFYKHNSDIYRLATKSEIESLYYKDK